MNYMQLQLFWGLVAHALQPSLKAASRGGFGFLGVPNAPMGNLTSIQDSSVSGGVLRLSEDDQRNTTSFQSTQFSGGVHQELEVQSGEASQGNMTSSQASKGNMTRPTRRPPEDQTTITTTTPKPLFPANPNVGSVDSDDTALTMKVIEEGMESAMEKFKKANAAFAKMTCAEIDDKRGELDKAYEELRDKAMLMRFEAAKANAHKSRDIKSERQKHITIKETMKKSDLAKDTRSVNVDARKAVVAHETTMILHLNALEQYALRCGVKDKWCEVGDTELNEKFKKLQKMTVAIDAKFTEAGWLRNEAVQGLATTETKTAAELRWGEAMRSVGEVWAGRKSLSTGLEVVTAACGLRPPPGEWAKPRKKCNLKPQDPMMQALLRDDPKEFERRWKEIIGKKAGVTADKVVVNVADCF